MCPRLTVLQSLLLLWSAGKHDQATKELVGIMLRCSPGSTKAKLLRGRRFNDDARALWSNGT